MNPVRIWRAGITASAVAHLSVLMLLLFFTEVHPYGSVTAEPITVDIVPAAEAPHWATLLRMRRERKHRRAAKSLDELAPLHVRPQAQQTAS